MLPKRYCESMKELLGEEYSDYIDSFSQSSHTAFRVNTGKISLEEWEAINPFETEKVFWTEKGYYYDAKKIYKNEQLLLRFCKNGAKIIKVHFKKEKGISYEKTIQEICSFITSCNYVFNYGSVTGTFELGFS